MYSVARMLSFGSNIKHFELGNQKFSFYAEAEFLEILKKIFENLGSNLVDMQSFSQIGQRTNIMYPTLKIPRTG